jgi:hypothetical protein
MIKFKHDGLQMSCRKACWKGYDGVDAMRWNLEVELFVALWVVQMEKDMHTWVGVVENHMPPWSIIGKEMCCWFMLRFQEGKDIDQT